MARSADERRAALLERITDYVAANGLSDLSLRPLADAVESSPRVLLYYFASKEDLIGEVLARLRGRQRDVFATLPRNAATYADTVRAAWKLMSAPEHAFVFRCAHQLPGSAHRVGVRRRVPRQRREYVTLASAQPREHLADQILLGREIVQQDARARLDRIGERPQRKIRKTVRGDVIGDPFEQCGAALVRAPCHTATLAHLKQSFQERAGRMYRGRQRRCPRRGGTGWTTRRNTGRRRRRFSGRSTTFRSAGSWRRASSASCI